MLYLLKPEVGQHLHDFCLLSLPADGALEMAPAQADAGNLKSLKNSLKCLQHWEGE